MIGIIALVITFSICKYLFMKDYEQVKRAHKAMELWEDDDEDEEQEECKEVSKKNG